MGFVSIFLLEKLHFKFEEGVTHISFCVIWSKWPLERGEKKEGNGHQAEELTELEK